MRFEALILLASVLIAAAEVSAAETQPESETPQGAEEGASPAATASVHVVAENIESGRGEVWLALCDKSLSVEGCPYRESIAASVGSVELTFDDIPPGRYAVVGYHDVNGNDTFDSLFGIPREPYALSGPAGEMLVPTFEDAAIQIKPGPNEVVIAMRGIADW